MAFGNMPTKKKKSPANQLTSDIIKYLSHLGCATARINTMGVYDQAKGKFRKSGSTLGVEDVNCTMPVKISGIRVGVTIAIEIKIGKDRQSQEQKTRQEQLEKAGGHYMIAKTWDQWKQDFDKLILIYAGYTSGS